MFDPQAVNGMIAILERETSPLHDAAEHRYEEDPKRPGACRHCGWLNPAGPELACGHTLHEHATTLLHDLKALKSDLGSGDVWGALVIEVTVVSVGSRRRHWPWQ